MSETDEFLTIPQIVRAAHARLPRSTWEFSYGGADSETTLRRNRSAFEHIAFRSRVLRVVTRRDPSTSFLGHRLSLPVMLAPVGPIAHYHPQGALACARAAERVGTATFVAMSSCPSLEDVRAGSRGPLIFQIYVHGDRAWLERLLRRVERAEYAGVCLTVDTAARGRLERDLHNRFLPLAGLEQPNVESQEPSADARALEDGKPAFTWDDVAWLREATRLRVILKGILSREDAELAVEHGVDVVYVSNHGGRSVDHAPATIEVLPEIVEAVRGRAEVIVDSGFMRGTDVVKALALGAKAVLVGKLMTWGLAAGGEAGLQRALELLEAETTTTMANVGARTVAELGPHFLRPSCPPGAAPWPAGCFEPDAAGPRVEHRPDAPVTWV